MRTGHEDHKDPKGTPSQAEGERPEDDGGAAATAGDLVPGAQPTTPSQAEGERPADADDANGAE